MYRLSKEEYSDLLRNAVTSKYKKTDKQTAISINKEGVKHAREGNIIDRIKINGTGNFLNRLSTRLLNPAKNEIGRISKHMLQNINTTISEKTESNK